MPEAEDKAKAEKLAAAKKRVAQLQKQKAKKASEKKKDDAAETSKEADTTAEASTDAKQDEPTIPQDSTRENEGTGESVQEPASEPTDDVTENVREENDNITPGPSHGRQPSLSLQSKMRSTSFRRTSMSGQGLPSSPSLALKSPTLPPLTPEGDTMPDIYRKQAMQIEELEKENRRLDKEARDGEARWRRLEEQLEDLRENGGEVVELKMRAERAEKTAGEVEKLRTEISSVQRINSQLQSSKSHRSPSNPLGGGQTSDSPPSSLLAQLDSKSSTIEAMELEISNMRAQLSSQTNSCSAHSSQIAALEDKLSRAEQSLAKTQRELGDAKHALSRASEKAVQEGTAKTSTETRLRSLEREASESAVAKSEAEKKISTLEKKLDALGKLHKESEARIQTRMRDADKAEHEAGMLRAKLASIENENLRLREERERHKKRDAGGNGDEEGLDELEDEERARLEKRVRDLEGEIFELRRGIWKERRKELAGEDANDTDDEKNGGGVPTGDFDEVDLSGGGFSPARRKSLASTGARGQLHQHSSFSTVLSSGLAAFTGGNTNTASTARGGIRGSLELLPSDDEAGFDEDAFRLAQEEEEARKRVEHVREVKRKLREWEGWRLDLVDSRMGVAGTGGGLGMGEIFEV